jgi:hypothetical protein
MTAAGAACTTAQRRSVAGIKYFMVMVVQVKEQNKKTKNRADKGKQQNATGSKGNMLVNGN